VRSKKEVGSLVCMSRRRVPGLGIVIEKTAHPPCYLGLSYEDSMMRKQLFTDGSNGYCLTVPSHSVENCLLVDWIKPPSEYQYESSEWKRTWVCMSWVKLVK